MKYLLVIILIGVALYYAMKWKVPGSSQTSQNEDDPYKGSSNSDNTDRGPYSNTGQANRSNGNGGSSYGKWLGGGLGWAFGGPIGGILGFMVGSMFEKGSGSSSQYGRTQSGDFNLALLILTAAVMKADGSVKRSELDYVKAFLNKNFGSQRSSQYVKMLGEILKQNVDVQGVSRQISQYMDYGSRMMLLQYLFGIAQADGSTQANEIDLIKIIAQNMGISLNDFESIKAMFVKDSASAYKVLGVEKTATNDEIKKAYRELAKQHHPDRVSHLGEEVKKAAEEKFTKLNAAYEAIKEERGLK